MSEKNSCFTYFAIKGDFNPDDITAKLGLSPTQQWRIGDARRHFKGYYDFALWKYGMCDEYDIDIENQMMKTISDLMPKIPELKEIKNEYDVSFVLEIVPSIYVGESTPCLNPNRAVIEFCYHTDTDIDIDLYVYNSDEEEE